MQQVSRSDDDEVEDDSLIDEDEEGSESSSTSDEQNQSCSLKSSTSIQMAVDWSQGLFILIQSLAMKVSSKI